jgi:competence protein ComEA
MKMRRTLWLMIGTLVSTLLLMLSTGEAGKTASQTGAGAGVETQQGEVGAPKGVSGERVNINTAGIDQLTALPGIGARTAERIKQYREENGGFKNLEDLKKVKGIGERNFERIKPHITI